MDVAAIVPAAGLGQRFGGSVSKLLAMLDGHPLLTHALQVLQRNPSIRWIQVVARQEDTARIAALLRRYRITKALAPCLGGASRAESVAKGFAALPSQVRWVLIHDAARPCLSPQVLTHTIRAAVRYGSVACGLPANVTVKAVDAHAAVRLTLDREQLWFVQTPQVFRRDWFAQALHQADHHFGQFPDDAAIVESAGFPVRMIPGDPLNLKVTTRQDLLLAEAILKQRR